MSILSKLKMAKTPKDLGQSIAEIEADISRAEEDIRVLEQSRERALFDDGEAAATKIQKEISAKRDHLELLQIARKGTLERQAVAEAAERKRSLEAMASKAAKDLLPPLQSALRDYHVAAAGLVEAAKKAAGLDAEVRQINQVLKENGRQDLDLPLPYVAAFARFRKSAFESGQLRLGSEKWEEQARAEGLDSVPAEAFPSLIFVSAPDLRALHVPGYVERGFERWERHYQYF